MAKELNIDSIIKDQFNLDNPDPVIKEIKKLYESADKNDEFEVMLYNFNNIYLSYEKYFNLLEFINKRAKIQKLKLVSNESLDINYVNSKTNETYRITISNMDNINKYMKMLHSWKNHVIFKVLLNKHMDGDKDIEVMKKVKSKSNTYDIPDCYMRFRLSEESKLDKKEFSILDKISHDQEKNITFRLKERLSVDLDEKVRIDLTKVRTNNNINRLEDSNPQHEVELEVIDKLKSKLALDLLIKEASMLLKIIQQSNFITTLSSQEMVLKEYSRIFNVDRNTITGLSSRQPVSLEVQHVTEILPNKYAVTDKADGDRYFLVILNSKVYLINTNLNVKYTGIVLDKKLEKYNDTVLDGEFIFLPKYNRHLFMVFDCLFNGKEDIRKKVNFFDRLSEADNVIKNCFIMEKQKGFEFKNSTSNLNVDNLVKFNETQIKEYMSALNHDILIEKKYPLIRRKYFIGANGIKPWEIFKYSVLIWSKFTEDESINCPYILDGLIYHPLEQDYAVKDSKMKEYKWKPPNKNSIDFYITFERDKITGKILTVYDNTNDDKVKNKSYKICNLHVGKVGYDGIMGPVLFNEHIDGYKCHLYLNDGEVRDLDGKMLSDNTVVEFYYNDNNETDFRFRWVPIRTRYDKTEASQRHKSNFGNYITTATNVWHSIMVPVIISDFQDLSRDDMMFDRKRELLRSKIGKEIIRSVTKENAYFQQKGLRVAKPFRDFRNNWYTSNLFYTYLNKNYNIDKKGLSVLDVACGRGRELQKFYYAAVANYVGFDIDSQALSDPTDGAVSRYENDRKKKPNYPKMEFFQADAGALLNYDDQYKALGGMSSNNKTIMEKFCSKDPKKRITFDRINCQFALHYFLKNKETWNNFKQNINDYLKPGGLLLAGGIFDAKQIIKYFGDKDKITEYYTDDNGDKKILWEVTKKFELSADKKISLGYAVDFFAAWLFNEGTTQTEYLVDKSFLIDEFAKDCDLELVETDLFSDLYEKHRDFLLNYSNYERNKTQTLNFLNKAKEYYKDDPVNLACRLNDKITRYYVFRKKETTMPTAKGGRVKKMPLDNTSYYKSIHDILRTHKIIPSSVSYDEFFKSLDIDMKSVDYKIGNKIIIEHELKNGKTRKKVNGLNIHIKENGKIEEHDSGISTSKTIILNKKDNHYEPYYEEFESGIRGFF